MTLDEIMKKLESFGNEGTKKVLMRHGAREPFFGVKIADLKKIVKITGKDHDLALRLFDTGNSDAMYLAGLIEEGDRVTAEQLEEWLDKAYWYMISEYIVAGLASESPFAHDKALEWMSSDDPIRASAGWATYSGMISLVPDEKLNLDEIRHLMNSISDSIASMPDRVRYNMNNFIISTGIYIDSLRSAALEIAGEIGRVSVDMGETSCKVPEASGYIQKAVDKGRVGRKRKRVIC